MYILALDPYNSEGYLRMVSLILKKELTFRASALILKLSQMEDSGHQLFSSPYDLSLEEGLQTITGLRQARNWMEINHTLHCAFADESPYTKSASQTKPPDGTLAVRRQSIPG